MSRRHLPRRTARAVLYTLGAIALGGWLLVHLTVLWVTAHPAVLALGVVAAGAVGYLRTATGPAPPRAPRPVDFLALSAGDFEQAVAALCRRDGCTRVQVVGGAGDLAADVLATTPGGKRILIQCKRYAAHNKVGSEHVQRVNGTYRDIHHCDVAAIVTTSSYTSDAIKLARRVGMRLYDAGDLAQWARGGTPPWH